MSKTFTNNDIAFLVCFVGAAVVTDPHIYIKTFAAIMFAVVGMTAIGMQYTNNE